MKKHFSLLVIILLISSMLYSIMNVQFWKKDGQVIKWDVLEYYGYLPATFIYKDVSLEFTKKPTDDWGKKFWGIPASDGKLVFKMTMGMSVMYAPFFGIAHLYATHSGYVADGFTAPYRLALLLSCLVYLLIGLLYLRKILLLFVSETITGFTILAVVAGTNLWYYASLEAPMSHAYSFSLTAIFIWQVIAYFRKPSLSRAMVIGLLTGLISLIRPNNALVIIVFILYGITNLKDLKNRLSFLMNHVGHILIMAAFAFMVWIPQLLYWHMQTGHWFYFSYGEHGAFYFGHPHLWEGLFGYRKGWFLYTPVMFLAVLAIPLTWKYARQFTFPILMFTALNVYVSLSWWCWWYGGCFGQRPFIDSYALLAIPLAFLMKWTIDQVFWKKIIISGLLVFSLILGVFHTVQYYYGAIHCDSMTREAYWESFGRIRPGPRFWSIIKAPDYDKALKGEKE